MADNKNDTSTEQQPASEEARGSRKLTIPIDGPLSLSFKGNRVEINIVMAISGQIEAVPTVLSLTPEASGQLIGCVKKALDEGLITLTLDSATPLQ